MCKLWQLFWPGEAGVLGSPMKTSYPYVFALGLLALAGSALAQSSQPAGTPPGSTSDKTATPAAPAQSTPPANPPPGPKPEETVKLSPFTVLTNTDKGWVAATTLSGNRTQEQLSNVPITVFAMTQGLMNDLNAFTLEDASRWAPGLSVIGHSDRRTDDQLTNYRGMTTGDRATTQSSRNFFSWFSPTDQYNIDRIDFNLGSNSLIYGDATPGGLPTTYTKVPQLSNFGTALFSEGSFGSYRAQIDINRKITHNLAVRINAVDRDNYSYIDFSKDALRAFTVAALYQPFEHTTIRAEFEDGLLRRIRNTEEDSIKVIAAPGKGYANTGWYLTSDGNIINNSATGSVAANDKIASSGTNYSFLNGEVVGVQLPGAVIQNYRGFQKELNVLGIGDYINRPYKNSTVWLDQSIGKLSIEAAANQQREVQQRNDTDFGGTGSGSDAGSVINIDGSGRPYVDMVDPAPKVYSVWEKAYHLTAAYPFEFGSWMKQFVVASYSNEFDQYDTTRYNLANFAVENGGAPVNITNNQIIFRAYLDNPGIYSRAFWDRFSFNTQNLPHTAAFQPGYYYNSDPNAPWVDDRYLKTWAFSSSGYYLGGKLHSLVGVRFDSSRRKRLVVQPNDAIGQAVFVGSAEAVPQDYAYDPELDLNNTSYSAGLLYNLFATAGSSLNVYADYATSYHFQGFEKYNGHDLGPVLGETREVGLKGDTFGHLLTYTFSFYRQYKKNAAFAWSNPSGFTTTGVGAANSLQTLFNPIGLSPSDPSYFTVATGNNSEDHTTSANERSKGVEFTFQLQRMHGFQVLLDGDYNQLSASRDFSDFQNRLAAALARQAGYIANGQPTYPAALIAGAESLLTQNAGLSDVSGLRETPYQANLLVDYQLAGDTWLRGTRFGLGVNYSSRYNLFTSTTVGTIRGDAEMPLLLYIIHERKIFNLPTSFRLGVTHLVDLLNINKAYRTVGITNLPTGTTPSVYQYAYFEEPVVTFTTTVGF